MRVLEVFDLDKTIREHHARHGRWWRYAVLRGENIPVHLNGLWLDMDREPVYGPLSYLGHAGRSFEATSQFEVREDGMPAVVFRLFTSRSDQGVDE